MISGGRLGAILNRALDVAAARCETILVEQQEKKRQAEEKAQEERNRCRFKVKYLDADKPWPKRAGRFCVGMRCFPRDKIPKEFKAGRHSSPVHKYRFDMGAYFQKYAGADKRLSWREVRHHPFVFVRGDGKGKRTMYGPTKGEFRSVQSMLYDSDPKTLNYMEFTNLAGYAGTYPHAFRVYARNSYKYDPHKNDFLCGEAYLAKASPDKRRAVRRAMREGISSAIEDTWPLKIGAIEKAAKAGKLAQMNKLIYSYLFQIEKMANKGNPALVGLCDYIPCYSSTYSVQEMASPASLRDPVIKAFWGDVRRIFDTALDKAKANGVRNIRGELRCLKEGSISTNYFRIDESWFKLFTLLERTNPDIVKRIKEWR